jgi:hypothetical protein
MEGANLTKIHCKCTLMTQYPPYNCNIELLINKNKNPQAAMLKLLFMRYLEVASGM